MVNIDNIIEKLKPSIIIKGPMFPEPVEIVLVEPLKSSIKIIGRGIDSNTFYQPILSEKDLSNLVIGPDSENFSGNGKKFQLAIEALRLGIAYEFDPYFSLSIARIDPLPHQLEAVYEYFLKLPRIRFLLADDPGAGKTIMAGLLIKELKIRGLIKRILLVTPANLTFQWQREMTEKFRETFHVIRGDVLRSTYGVNPWLDKDQVVTSVSWISHIEDARESLLKSNWDLIIVDEAHKMSASKPDKKTKTYIMGEKLSEITDHFLLMTATPHKGDKEHFRMFLSLLDKDVYGNISSIEEALRTHEAPFYLRRVKEALVTFPDEETGKSKSLFTRRDVMSVEFQIDEDEYDFYQKLTRFVEHQSVKAAQEDSNRARAVGFTMAMLQRRFASSVFAVRRSLERMMDKREEILKNPDAYRKQQIERKLPEDIDDWTEEDREKKIAELEEEVISYNPAHLQEEIKELNYLIKEAKELEIREIETKLLKLKSTLTERGIFKDPRMKLLIFTEHKDTLTYLIEKLQSWGLSVTAIHGGMKIGSRNEPGTRLHAEREFREDCQVLIATEAAGEGINLQFCWFMINYDIPWNPIRLEQRMGRIHRYGQNNNCLILNFISTNTREGRVFQRLFERIQQIERDLDEKRTGKVFNVLGDVIPPKMIEQMLREMYAKTLEEKDLLDRIVENVDLEHIKRISDSALEGLAKKDLNLSVIVGKRSEAKERRLVPEVIRDFFVDAAPYTGFSAKNYKREEGIFKIGKVPKLLYDIGEKQEPQFGVIGRTYKDIGFDRKIVEKNPQIEWVTPGHPLFEAVRTMILKQSAEDLENGAIFYDLHRDTPAILDIFSTTIRDGRGNVVHRRLFVTEQNQQEKHVRQPMVFLDLTVADDDVEIPDISIESVKAMEQFLIEESLNPFLEEILAEREREVKIISNHIEISLTALITRQNEMLFKLVERQSAGDSDPLIPAHIQSTSDRIDDLNRRLDRRRLELEQERSCTIGDILHHGRALVLPSPARKDPRYAGFKRDDTIERIAIQKAIEYEESLGWIVESVEDQNRGFDLISRRMHAEDPKTASQVKFIEVKGRSTGTDVLLSTNEFKTAERLGNEYWLYVVYDCTTDPQLHRVQNPSKMKWEPIVKIEHYHITGVEIIRDEFSI